MNCRATQTPDKLHGSLHPPPKKGPSVALGTPSMTLKISRKLWISLEQKLQLRISTIRGKLFAYYIYTYLEQNKSNNVEILL